VTTPAPPASPRDFESPQERRTVETKRSRRVYVYWGIALTVLVAAGLFCWLFLVPVLRARSVLLQPAGRAPWATQEIRELGGPGYARTCMALYLRLPGSLAPDQHRGQAAYILSWCGEPAFTDLLRLTRDRQPSVRWNAASGLGNIGDRAAVRPLIALLRDPSPIVRRFATAALGNLKAREAVPEIIAVLGDKDAEVRIAAAGALIPMRDARAVPALIGQLKNQGPKTRAEIAQALGFLHTVSPHVIPALIGCLRDQSPKVRQAAALALAHGGDARAIGPLSRIAASDPDRRARSAAKIVLSIIKKRAR
jgi:HEAT repeat protein